MRRGKAIPVPVANARDYQRKRVYTWEDETLRPTWESPISELEAGFLVRFYCERHRVGYPRIRFRSSGRNAWSCRGSAELVLPPWAMVDVVLYHELAHWIIGDQARYPGLDDSHGPIWCSLYAEILATGLARSRSSIVAEMIDSGIEVADPL